MTFDVHQLDSFVLVGATVTFLAVLAVRMSSRAGLPSLLVYLLMGVALGEAGLGVGFENAELAHALGFGALAIILAEGGLTTNWADARPAMRMGLSLATVGVLISVGIVAIGSHYLLGLPWELAVLLGAVCSPTDAAAVFSVLRVIPLPKRISSTLEAESGLNDAPTVVVVSLVASGAFAEHGLVNASGIVLYELVAGVAFGLAAGFGGAWVMRRAALPSTGLYPIAILCLTLIGYGASAAVHASGFAAVYVAALVLGNADLPHRSATRSFVEGLAWLAQIGLFVMLGLLLSPERITWSIVGLAIAAGLILTFVARPISVAASALVLRPFEPTMRWNELGFLSWAGLRGAVPIVLTTIPLAEGVDGAGKLFDIVFVMVILFTLLTGLPLPKVGQLLRVALHSEPRDIEVEAAPLERVAADLLQITISPQSRMHGVEVGELRLPVGASVSMIVREGQAIVPERRTVLRHGDDLIVVTPRRLRDSTEQRLRQVSIGGRLAQWLGDEPAPQP